MITGQSYRICVCISSVHCMHVWWSKHRVTHYNGLHWLHNSRFNATESVFFLCFSVLSATKLQWLCILLCVVKMLQIHCDPDRFCPGCSTVNGRFHFWSPLRKVNPTDLLSLVLRCQVMPCSLYTTSARILRSLTVFVAAGQTPQIRGKSSKDVCMRFHEKLSLDSKWRILWCVNLCRRSVMQCENHTLPRLPITEQQIVWTEQRSDDFGGRVVWTWRNIP